eukprot:scaffold31709_cov118-Isochrysis_galbana.AAC.7
MPQPQGRVGVAARARRCRRMRHAGGSRANLKRQPEASRGARTWLVVQKATRAASPRRRRQAPHPDAAAARAAAGARSRALHRQPPRRYPTQPMRVRSRADARSAGATPPAEVEPVVVPGGALH